jgi:transcription elongation factor GreB
VIGVPKSMSKAFTKEDDGADDDSEPLEPPPPSGPQYITPAGYSRLADELDHLWRVDRPKVTREVEAAAAMGDRSENAEYIYGKKRLREIDRRLRYLKKRLEALTVVSDAPPALDRVYFGAHVTVTDEDGQAVTYRLVGGDEINLEKRWISVASPVGKALLGKHRGDVVVVQRPRGEAELCIVAIRYDQGPG